MAGIFIDSYLSALTYPIFLDVSKLLTYCCEPVFSVVSEEQQVAFYLAVVVLPGEICYKCLWVGVQDLHFEVFLLLCCHYLLRVLYFTANDLHWWPLCCYS